MSFFYEYFIGTDIYIIQEAKEEVSFLWLLRIFEFGDSHDRFLFLGTLFNIYLNYLTIRVARVRA